MAAPFKGKYVPAPSRYARTKSKGLMFYFGTPGWGWTLWGIGYGSKWFLGFSMKRTPADDAGTIVLPAGKTN